MRQPAANDEREAIHQAATENIIHRPQKYGSLSSAVNREILRYFFRVIASPFMQYFES